MTRDAKRFRLLLSAAAVSFALILLLETGCFRVPVHVAPKTEGAGGKGTTADPATIQPGKSTREEIEHSWNWCEVPAHLEGLFLCGVKRSTWREVQSIMFIPLDVSRDWEQQSLFVEFNPSGIVSKTYFVSDVRFMRTFVEWMNRNPQPPLDLSQPIELVSSGIDLYRRSYGVWHGVNFPGTVRLRPDELVLEPKQDSGSTIQLTRDHFGKLNLSNRFQVSLLVNGLPTRYSHLEIALKEADKITFLRYLQQVQPMTFPSTRQKGGQSTR
jgi:hypothetical protein